jgi:hypothetical protein
MEAAVQLLEEKINSGAGIALARGEVLAFTDSDCTPTAGWLAAALGCLQELGTCGIVAGRIQLVPRDPQDLSLVEAYASTFFLRQRAYAEQMGFGATANLVAHASAFARVGSFDAALKSSGDYDFCTRATKQGVLLRYAPEAVVNHPTITTLGGLVRKSRRLVGGNVQLRFRGRAYRLANVLRDLTIDAVEARASWRWYRAERIEGDPNLAMAGLILVLQTVRGLERLRLFLNGGHGYLR